MSRKRMCVRPTPKIVMLRCCIGSGIIIIIIITVFIQRLTHRRLVYNGITQV